MAGHEKKQEDMRPLWVQVPLTAELKQDLVVLAKIAGEAIGDYCHSALNQHVNGRRQVLEAVACEIQKERRRPPPDPWEGSAVS